MAAVVFGFHLNPQSKVKERMEVLEKFKQLNISTFAQFLC